LNHSARFSSKKASPIVPAPNYLRIWVSGGLLPNGIFRDVFNDECLYAEGFAREIMRTRKGRNLKK
jgi:hypothetical protein